jgi:tetratricopeptide (TPR) repeat protein
MASIDHIYRERFRDAEDEARKIIKKYPAHPAGYFFMAAAIDAWMSTHCCDSREFEFYRFCDLAVEKGEKIIEKNNDDQWARFFIGGVEGYKGTYEARFGRWITAFRYGWKGVSILSQLKDHGSKLVDIDYGIGSYEYWRSAMMKSLRWMPGVADKRSQGIEKLHKAQTKGMYTRLAAATGLIDIYLNEKNYDKALTIADNALETYPNSRWLLIGKAKAHLGENNYNQAENAVQRILSGVEKDPSGERATIALCHYWFAKIYLSADRFAECIAECDLMKQYRFGDDSKKILDPYFEESESIKKLASMGKKLTRDSRVVSKNSGTKPLP